MLQKSLGVTFAQDDKARAAAWTVLYVWTMAPVLGSIWYNGCW